MHTLLEGLDFFCHCFLGPTPEFCETLLSKPAQEMFERLAELLGDAARPEIELLREEVSELADTTDLFDALSTTYIRLFVSTLGGVPAPLYQSCYESDGGSLMGSSAQAMQERLERCGLSVSLDAGEPPDHLPIQLEYLFFLLDTGWREEDSARLEEAASFVEASLLPWMRRVSGRIDAAGEAVFYPSAAALLCRLLERIMHGDGGGDSSI